MDALARIAVIGRRSWRRFTWWQDWKKIAQTVVASLEEAARDAKAQQQIKQRRGPRKQCLFWDCDKSIRADHVLCYEHYGDLQDGLVDECPGCGLAKYAQYEQCLDCYNKRAPKRETKSWYKPEHSEAWEKGDAEADIFFVYLLKLAGGDFYAGQTRELRERLSEHRDGRVKSTAGKNPKLVWFGELPTRAAAAETEVELKKLVDRNPREIRRIVIGFKDLVSELDYS